MPGALGGTQPLGERGESWGVKGVRGVSVSGWWSLIRPWLLVLAKPSTVMGRIFFRVIAGMIPTFPPVALRVALHASLLALPPEAFR
jgi:hypothetical protein